ncbi:hypothetical protein J437_LFUL016499 [Ladona fulva]|uniref:C2H2-type domain-containing protein n=1 Tax=Ladona fulva TaxID=123851 RepID=A0A8K0KM13_LADFU|nr:hypothetical protein J437_LFUL016499 [Ladona fulva]
MVLENQIFIKHERDYCENYNAEKVDEEAEETVGNGYNQIFIKEEQECSDVYPAENPVPVSAPQYFNPCEFCFKRFRFYCRWKRHTASHQRPKVSRVPIVDLSTLVVEEPRGRRSVESNDIDSDGKKRPRRRRDLTCSLCGKCFTQKNNLHRHKLVHLGTKPFQCDECGLRFTEKSALDRHQVVHVGGGDVFKCSQCGKAFNRKSNLERHSLIHSGGRRHPCLTCGKTFTQRAHLRRHEETHSGSKELECEECGKRFNRRGNLNVHALLHKGIKPFQCDFCGRKFSQKVNLRMHLKMQHNTPEGDT